MSEEKETKIVNTEVVRPKGKGFSIADYVDVSAAITKGKSGDIQLVMGQRVKIEKLLDDLLK